MKKGTRTFLAAFAALALSGGAFAQTNGGMSSGSSSHGTTASPATNQMNDTSSGYGMPGAANSESGMSGQGASMGQQPGMTNGTTSGTSAPKSNNSLATPSVKSPVGN
nr:hypothetical protein [Paraburkholderia sp.]